MRSSSAFDREFADAVVCGLQSKPKWLPSKYLYDERGDGLFQRITQQPEYYITRCEEEILKTNREKLLAYARGFGKPFTLAELGAGDGKKTSILLSHFVKQGCRFTYMPVDNSTHVLEELRDNLSKKMPSLEVRPLRKEYISALHDIGRLSQEPALVLFLGGNIGNFSKEEASGFLQLLAGRLKNGDMLLTGFDLKKDPAMIYHAYNDRRGVTRAFTFNLLQRINRELGADFNAARFMHYPTYDPESGAMKSYLISETSQVVTIGATGTQVVFRAWEPMLMEVSNKYHEAEIMAMADRAGLEIRELLYDRRSLYVDAIFVKRDTWV